MSARAWFGVLIVAAALAPAAASGGSTDGVTILGPPPPTSPEVISRDDSGRATVRAVRIERPIAVDGRLDEAVYGQVQSMGGFLQQSPHEGEPATERTEAWVFFDDKNLYIAARCWDSHPERDVVSELRRDLINISNNENFVVILDTFYDRRNGFYFQTNPLGAVRDQAVTDEGSPNESWNTIWDVKSGKFDQGWTVEMAVPFKSLRYRDAGPQTWGINFRRTIKWKNEETFLTRISISYGLGGIYHLAQAGTLVGLQTPAQSMNLEIKPYAVSSVTSDLTTAVPTRNQFAKNVGVDFKYGLTRSVIADATFNTDFAQVEEDVQQVNLTRFSLFFPEKREFFLEGQGIFSFGGASSNAGSNSGDVPVLFFSRQIGLSQGQSVPVVAGGRMTGRLGPFNVGALNIETGEKPEAGANSTNFSAVRIKRDIFRRSNVGVLATNRAPSGPASVGNAAFGVDANLFFFKAVNINSYYARTRTAGASGDESSYRGRFEYAGDRYGLAAEGLAVGREFDPQVGFVRRRDFLRNYLQARFSPRPARSRLIRRVVLQGNLDYVTDYHRTQVQNREQKGSLGLELHNSDKWTVEYAREFEDLPKNFTISPGVVVPKGGYTYDSTTATYVLGQQHVISGTLAASRGTFYNGTKTQASYSGRAIITPRFGLEPGLSLNWVDLPYGSFTASLVSTRIIVTPSPRMMISSLLQLNAGAHTLSSSVRLRWEYAGGSELFVVYSDGRNTLTRTGSDLLNRTVALKATRLLRF